MLVPLQTTEMHIDAPVSAVDERGDHQHLHNTLTCISMLVPLQNTDMHIDADDPASMAGQAELGLPDTPPFSDKPCPQDSKPQSSESQSCTPPPPPPPPPPRSDSEEALAVRSNAAPRRDSRGSHPSHTPGMKTFVSRPARS